MRLSLRFVLPLLLVLAGIAYALAPLVDRLTLRWFVRDIEIRAALIANTIHEPLLEQLAAGKKAKTSEFFNRISQDERLYAIGYCATPESPMLASRTLPAEISCGKLLRWDTPGEHLLSGAKGLLHVAVVPVSTDTTAEVAASGTVAAGQLVLVHDMSFITRRSEETKRYLFYVFMALAAAVSLITVVVAQLSWRGWMAGMQALLRGRVCCADPRYLLSLACRASSPSPGTCSVSSRNWSPRTARAMKASSPGRPIPCGRFCVVSCAARM